ncbi:RNA polymerase factor sigma-54 [Solitalea sp. MAHUQ-68]|uniref:RNA polymerase factor sigma-54 n=1 Tax=Solitalea agri TaxID=2953739 RepID=A0A9X2F840_9SPHI|nr:RNA polymerase factor sigma-54 [Solitalea agri]MCO4292318.1 RNA polymerase factor sigma-54 [Solitalea agri]
MLKQNLQQKLLQKLSPQQLQFIKLLQIPTVMLDARIKEELEENPALEDISLMAHNEEKDEYDFDNDDKEDFKESESDLSEEFSIEDYLQQDDEKDYATSLAYDSDDDDDKKELPYAESRSFFEMLQFQLNMVDLDDRHFLIAQQIIGSLDDDGYLRRPVLSLIDDLAFSQNVDATEEEVEDMMKIIQSFDPPGIGARDLQECLLIQLRKKDQDNRVVHLAIEIVENYLDEFTKKHYDKLERSLGISSDELKAAVNEILKLNPKPGDSSADSNIKQMQVIPDFHIANNDGVLILTLNSRNAPELRVSRDYKEMFQTYDKQTSKDKKLKEAVQFVKQKLDSAKWFIDAIKQRQQTLIKTMNAIMHYQYDYFLEGDERKLKPMILKDIADQIGMDISTVSRVANSKYVQTEFGTFLLKSFFSEAIQTESGEEVSNREVKKILEDCIGNEDKRRPLADEKLAEILKDKGYNIARRTVAKYREQMNIPVARLRKEL